MNDTVRSGLGNRTHCQWQTGACRSELVRGQCLADSLHVGPHLAEARQVALSTFESLPIPLLCLLVIRHGSSASPDFLGRAGLYHIAVIVASWAVALCACVFTPPPPLPEELAAERAAQLARAKQTRAGTAATPGAAPPGSAPTETSGDEAPFKKGDLPRLGMTPEQVKAYAVAQGDPEAGEFTLDEALVGLGGPEKGELWASFKTARGTIECKLAPEHAPVTVANFVGLARGLRPVLDSHTDTWGKRPYYDATTFHRVVPGFMIQGGDPTGTGMGHTGYVIVDEFTPELVHDDAGVLSMANRGPTSGSAGFFVTLGPASHLDGKHTVFGKCTEAGMKIADDIAMVPRDADDKPLDPERLEKVTIGRR